MTCTPSEAQYSISSWFLKYGCTSTWFTAGLTLAYDNTSFIFLMLMLLTPTFLAKPCTLRSVRQHSQAEMLPCFCWFECITLAADQSSLKREHKLRVTRYRKHLLAGNWVPGHMEAFLLVIHIQKVHTDAITAHKRQEPLCIQNADRSQEL